MHCNTRAELYVRLVMKHPHTVRFGVPETCRNINTHTHTSKHMHICVKDAPESMLVIQSTYMYTYNQNAGTEYLI